MKNNQETAPTPKELLHDLQVLVAEAETMMTSSLSEHSAEALDTLRTRFHAAQERFSDLYEGAKKKVVAGAKCTDETIRANPYQSIAIAAGVGLLVGVLLGRRSK
ncbi:MAG: DUF883 domain-containing protein [Verrucomicrobia bacterium]|nr:DUF883 domain-containing protein [Verrucomicrobiota bacterium]